MASSFADRIVTELRRLGHPLCVGLDPHLNLLPPIFRRGTMAPAEPATADAVEAFLAAVLERLAGKVAVVKPQAAFFERLGWRGLRVLEATIKRAGDHGLEVLIDAKRGDIGSTARAYAGALLGDEAAFPGDALTVNPYLGLDTLEPFVDRAEKEGCGLFVLVRTSNPGAGDFQDVQNAEGRPLFYTVAEGLRPLADRLRGPVTGWSALGVVVGATWPGEAEAVRQRLPHSLVLVPGYGAQGGSAADAVRAFVPGPDGHLEGGLVNSSRGILYPELAGETAGAWERAFDEGLERAIDDLRGAVTR